MPEPSQRAAPMPDLGHDMPSPEASTCRLLERMRQGDETAADTLYRRYLPALQTVARGRLPAWARDLLNTDDLVQEALLRTLHGLGSFEPEHSGALQGYLRRTVLNRVRDEMRRVGRRGRPDGSVGELPDPRPSPAEEAVGREALARYETALERLRPEERDAVVARVELGFSFAEIAESLGKPSPDAARMAVSRALVRLAREMGADG